MAGLVNIDFTGNGTHITAGVESCQVIDYYVTMGLFGLMPLFLILSVLLKSEKRDWLAPAYVFLFAILANEEYLQWVQPIFSEQFNISLVQYLPLVAAGILAIFACLRNIGEFFIIFALLYYIMNALDQLTNIYVSLGVGIALTILVNMERFRNLVRFAIRVTAFGLIFTLLYAAVNAPDVHVAPCATRRNYIILCEPKCPVITSEMEKVPMTDYVIAAAVTVGSILVGLLIARRCCLNATQQTAKRVKQLETKLQKQMVLLQSQLAQLHIQHEGPNGVQLADLNKPRSPDGRLALHPSTDGKGNFQRL